jgi:hypothetical protein
MTPARKLQIPAALACLLAAASVPAASPLPQYSRDQSLGVASCASSLCHGAVETWKNSRVLQNEYVTWSRSDKHARAYAVLLNARSQEIARKLGLKEPAHRSGLCLDCHAHNVPAALRGERFVLSDGVTCEACHGPAERWIRSHVEPRASHAGNLANGLYPISDPVAQARLCLSCHFGNPQKLVTHRIMAAGHPRLSFELDTFTRIQPPHFEAGVDRAGSKPADMRLSDGIRRWAIGQALAAHELLDILNDPNRGRDGLFPELVLFDCHACHHSMSDPRNAGGRLGVGPGVVRLNDASLLMVRHIARSVDAEDAARLARQVSRLHRAVATGHDALAEARAVQEMIARLVPRIGGHRFSEEDLRGILLGLIDDGLAGQYSDYQGAEQAVMALQAVADFMARRGMLRPASIGPAMTRLLGAVAHDEKYPTAAFGQALRELKSTIQTGKTK